MEGETLSTASSIEAKRNLVKRHVERELAHDWDGALETMTDSPFYEHYPLGIRVRGRRAVTSCSGNRAPLCRRHKAR